MIKLAHLHDDVLFFKSPLYKGCILPGYTHQNILPDVDEGVQEHDHSGANDHLSVLQLTEQAGRHFLSFLWEKLQKSGFEKNYQSKGKMAIAVYQGFNFEWKTFIVISSV